MNTYFGWNYVLWFGIFFLLFSSMNWGYTYRAHRRFDDLYGPKSAFDVLNERYAKGEINREDYYRMKAEILDSNDAASRKKAS